MRSTKLVLALSAFSLFAVSGCLETPSLPAGDAAVEPAPFRALAKEGAARPDAYIITLKAGATRSV